MSSQETNLKAIADAIREKDGTSEPIPARTFPERIRAIKTGSGFAVPLQVDVDPGANVVATLGDDRVEGIAGSNGKVSLILPRGGVWTVGATLDDKSVTPKELEVVSGYSLKFSFSSRLPEGYTELAYVDTCATETGNVAYFDTGLYAKQGFKVIVDMQPLGYGAYSGYPKDSYAFFAYRSSSGDNVGSYNLIFQLLADNTYRLQCQSINNGNILYGKNFYTLGTFPGRCVLEWDELSLTVKLNGEVVISDVNNPGWSYSTAKIYLPRQVSGSGTYYGAGRFYSYKYYINDEIQADFVPCKNLSGVVGMYDVIRAKFYKSANSTSFVAGPEV